MLLLPLILLLHLPTASTCCYYKVQCFEKYCHMLAMIQFISQDVKQKLLRVFDVSTVLHF